jgi:hypothetical protein
VELWELSAIVSIESAGIRSFDQPKWNCFSKATESVGILSQENAMPRFEVLLFNIYLQSDIYVMVL